MRLNKFSLKTKVALAAASALLIVVGCNKVEKGYLSKDIFYLANPFEVSQGVTTTSESLVYNGSTAPLEVKVLSLTDSAGNDMDSTLTTPRSIVTFTGTVDYQDTTLEMLQAKLKDSLVAPFSVATIGGRLQFTMATSYVPTGSYYLSLYVSNVKGGETLPNICTINITPLQNTYTYVYKRLRYMNEDGTDAVATETALSYTMTHTSGTSTSKIIYQFEDKNGKLFNPAAGEVTRWVANYPTMQDWDPYYKEVATDSSLEYQFPSVGLTFPFFGTTYIQGTQWIEPNAALTYYKIPGSATNDGRKIQVCTSFSFLTSGTYVMRVHMNDAVHK